MFPLKKICLVGLILLMGISVFAQARRNAVKTLRTSPAKAAVFYNQKAEPYIVKVGKIEYVKDSTAYVFLTSKIPTGDIDIIIFSCDIKSAPSALLNFNEFNPIYYKSVYAMEITEGTTSAGDIVYVKVIPRNLDEDATE